MPLFVLLVGVEFLCGLLKLPNHSCAPARMRPSSLAKVRKEKRSPPIRIVVYKGERPHLADGRHRVQVARERGKKTIPAIVEYRGPQGGAPEPREEMDQAVAREPGQRPTLTNAEVGDITQRSDG
ncbi:MAG: hypothetical protein WBY94_24945 [Polyangiaceae bacterium]